MNAFHQAVTKYRECSRHVRNVYFQSADNAATVEADKLNEGWREVDRMLFNWLILYPHGLQPVTDGQSHPRIGLRVPELGARVFINKGKFINSGSWDHPTNILYPDDCALIFRQFFDFDEWSPIDFKYVMAEIINAKDDDLNGRLVLIEWQRIESEIRNK